MVIEVKLRSPWMYHLYGLIDGMVATVTAQGFAEDAGRVQILAWSRNGGGYVPVWLSLDEFDIISDSVDAKFDENLLNLRHHYF